MDMWKKIIWIPVWGITNAMKWCFRKDHPWKKQKLTLQSWCERGTPAAKEVSLTLWVFGLVLVCLLIRLASS